MSGDEAILLGAAELLRAEARQDSYRTDPRGWAADVLGVHLWSKQMEVATSVRDSKRTVVASCHGTGKALALDTPLPTPTGWTTMEEVRAGDELIAVDGTPTRVRAVSRVWEVDTYRITFSNGEVITASGDHEWFVLDKRTRNRVIMRAHREGRPVDWRGDEAWGETRILTTRQLLAEGVRAVGATREYNFAVPAAAPVQGVETGFVEDPYRMGLRACELPFDTWRMVVRASLDQRTAFASGLADAYGHCHKGVVWLTLDAASSVFASDLFTSLGELVGDASFDAEGRVLLPVRTHANYFSGDGASRQAWQEHREALKRSPRLDLRMITDIIEVPVAKTKCVEVEHPRHGYLAGSSMVPTHNSMIASVIACWWVAVHPPGQAIVITTAPTYHQVNAILWEEMRKHHRTAKARGNPLPGYITQDNQWKLADGALVGMGRKPADGDAHAFQGIHRPYVLVVVDEACHDDQTDVLTDQGWKRFADLDGTEKLLTMDARTHEAYYDKPVKLVAKPYSGPMHYYSAKGLNYAVTPDHTMLYAQRKSQRPLSWRTAERQEIATWSNKFVKKVIDWTQPDDPALSDDWLEFLGWFGSEGSINKDLTRVCITQSAEREAHQRIFELCERLGFNPKKHGDHVLINSTELARELAQWGRTQLVRRVPDFVRNASARQIGVYLDAYAEGDGYWHGTREVIYTSSPQMADDLQELILKTGMPSVVSKRELAGKQTTFPDGHVATSSVDGYVVTRPYRSSNAKMYNENEQVSHYEGMVYCATMPKDHLLFTRRNGYTMWSGNCGVPEELWTGVEAITTTNNSRILAIGNPDDRDTTFGDVYLDDRYSDMWNRIHIPASSTPNFTGEPVPDPLPDVLVQRDWVRERERAWGADDPRYQSKVEANFPEQSALTLFSAAVRAKAFDSGDESKTGPLVLGVDPARYGDDRTAVVAKRGRLCWVVDSWMGMDTVSSASRVLNLASGLRERDAEGVPAETGIEIRVDAIGLGAGVVDTLASWQADLESKGQAWFRVREMNGSAAAPVEQGGVVATYGNARAFWYDHARQDMANGVVKIVPFDVLDDELSGVRFKYSAGKLYIESKDDMRKRGVKSPDFADAFVYAAAHIFSGPEDGTTYSQDADDVMAQALFEEYEERLDTMISPF